MKIGILGSGDVGQSLGLGFISLGYGVKMGSRNPAKAEIKSWLNKAGPKASAGSLGEAAAYGEMAVLATAWSGAENAVRLAGPDRLSGKIIIEATNPLRFEPNAPAGLAVGGNDSAGEQVQRWLPKAKVVKALNTVNHAHMVHPSFPDGPPDMFICGNDAHAKEVVTGILKAFGWGVIDMGGIEAARLLEAMALVYIRHAIRTDCWDYAFKLLKK